MIFSTISYKLTAKSCGLFSPLSGSIRTIMLLDGQKVAETWREDLSRKVGELKNRGITPGLGIVLVGNDPASEIYTRIKEKVSLALGFHTEKITLEAQVTTETIIQKIEELNQNPQIHGIIVQLPLPEKVDSHRVLSAIALSKDADGLNPQTLGNLMVGKETLIPATPKAILKLLGDYKISISGKRVVIVGRSNILGKPLAIILLSRDATVTICHSKTTDLAELTNQADIIVMDVGKPLLLTADMVGDHAVVIDAGITRLPNGRIVGDVDYSPVAAKAFAITPVPGGVGPLTVTALLDNTLLLADTGDSLK